MLNVLITGATGFIGKYLVKYLKQNDKYNIYTIGRRDSTEQNNYLMADISDRNFVDNVFANIPRCDIVIHLAACINMTNDAEIIKANCQGTYNMCELVNEWKSSKYIYMSSIPVIGVPQEIPITENHKAEPKTLYHTTKFLGEKMVTECVDDNVRKVILRIPSPVGVGMNCNTFLPIILNKASRGEDITLYGKGLRRQNYVDVRDIVSVIINAIEYDVEGLFNIASKRAISNIELAKLCKNITCSSSKIVFAGIEDKEEFYNWDISIDKAKRELKYAPQYSIEESIKWMIGN